MEDSKKKIVFIDMDGVLVDFGQAIESMYEKYPEYKITFRKEPDLIPEIFKDPIPIKGAIKSIQKLAKSGQFDLFIATTASWGNPEAAMHKRLWIEKYFGNLFLKKMFITHRKDLLIGDYLIDDRLKNGASEFKGELLSFGHAYETKEWNEYRTWEDILKKLL